MSFIVLYYNFYLSFNHCIFTLLCVLYVLLYCTNPAFGCYISINFFSSDQYRTLNGSIYAVHQSISGFNTGDLGRPLSADFVIGSVRVGIDV